MKIEELPQNKSDLENFTRELCYAKNKDGKYETGLSTGWDVKKSALDNAWNDIENTVEEAKELVRQGKKSPVYYFMQLNLMDISLLSGYTGFWKFTIKRHLKPDLFKKLRNKKLQKYADAFDISIDELKNFKG
jgi:hypothetical protein